VVVLPIMLYHPMQLVVCAWLARRYAKRPVAISSRPLLPVIDATPQRESAT
jgi:sodium/bile acid cotransporter 7